MNSFDIFSKDSNRAEISDVLEKCGYKVVIAVDNVFTGNAIVKALYEVAMFKPELKYDIFTTFNVDLLRTVDVYVFIGSVQNLYNRIKTEGYSIVRFCPSELRDSLFNISIDYAEGSYTPDDYNYYDIVILNNVGENTAGLFKKESYSVFYFDTLYHVSMVPLFVTNHVYPTTVVFGSDCKLPDTDLCMNEYFKRNITIILEEFVRRGVKVVCGESLRDYIITATESLGISTLEQLKIYDYRKEK